MNPFTPRARAEALEPRRLLHSAYLLDVLARTGDVAFTGEQITGIDAASINDAGDVAFNGDTPQGEALFNTAPNALINRLSIPLNPTWDFGAPQINDAGKVAAADSRFIPTLGLTLESARVYDLVDGGNPFLAVSTTTSQPPAGINPNTGLGLGDFVGVLNPSVEPDGRGVAFVGRTERSNGEPFTTVFELPADRARGEEIPKLTFDLPISGNSTPQPWLAEDGHSVVYDPFSQTGGAVLYDYSPLVEVGSLYDAVGRRPHVSDDGRFVAFAADLTAGGAALFGTTPGPGVFLYDVQGTNTVYRLAGVSGNGQLDPGEQGDFDDDGDLDPGEVDLGRFGGFDLDAAVGVGYDPATGRVHVAFTAADVAGREVVYSVRMPDPQGPAFAAGRMIQRLVARADDPRLGLPGPATFTLHDPVNDLGEIVFTASSGGQGVVVSGEFGGTIAYAGGIYDTEGNADGDHLDGSFSASIISDVWSRQPGVHVEVPFRRNSDDPNNANGFLNGIVRIDVLPGESLVMHLHTHGAYEDPLNAGPGDNDEPPVSATENIYDPGGPTPFVTPGDEYALMSYTGDADLQILTDDNLAGFLGAPALAQVNKLFVNASCFSGGFWQDYPAAADQDLAAVPNMALLASSPEEKPSYGVEYQGNWTSRLLLAMAKRLNDLADAGAAWDYAGLVDGLADEPVAHDPDNPDAALFQWDQAPGIPENASPLRDWWETTVPGWTPEPFVASTPGFDFTVGGPPAADVDAPLVTGAAFEFESRQAVTFDFDENVAASLEPGDVVVANLTTGDSFSPDAVEYDAATDTAAFTFDAPLPDGNYAATLAAGTAQDAAGNPLADPQTLDFFVLAGDFNRDRVINTQDLLTVIQSFGTPQALGGGDANYDGIVNTQDLLAVIQKFGQTLPPPAATLFGAGDDDAA